MQMQENKTNALDVQVGGNHYKKQLIQPIELAYILNASPCFTKLAKYLSREKGNREQDLEKAKHVISLEESLSCFDVKYGGIEKGVTLYWIKKFSSNSDIQNALYTMYIQDYTSAIFYVESFTAGYKNTDIQEA